MSENQKPKLTRGFRWLLIGSVTLNILVLAFVVAGGIAAKNIKGQFGPNRDATFALMRALDKEDRKALMGQRWKERQPQGTRPRTADFIALIGADPFDPDALRKELYDAGTFLQKRGHALSDALVERIEVMNAEERAAYIERIKVQREKRGRRKGKKEDR